MIHLILQKFWFSLWQKFPIIFFISKTHLVSFIIRSTWSLKTYFFLLQVNCVPFLLLKHIKYTYFVICLIIPMCEGFDSFSCFSLLLPTVACFLFCFLLNFFVITYFLNFPERILQRHAFNPADAKGHSNFK